MSEGEFKKRMTEMRLRTAYNVVIPDFITDMLDEARKEFPQRSEAEKKMLSAFTKGESLERGEDYDDNVTMWLERLRTEWFLKWFGSVKE